MRVDCACMDPCSPEPAETGPVQAQKCELVSQALLSNAMVRIRALGTSMLPTIWPGDILVIEPGALEHFVTGDLIVAETLRDVRVHRLISKAGPHWMTRGDSMPQDDPVIRPEDVLGRVSAIRRGQRVIIPQRRLLLVTRGLAWLLSFAMICRIALRLRSGLIGGLRQANTTQPHSDERAS